MAVLPVYPMQHQEHTFTKTYVSPEFCLHGTPCVSSVRRLAETRTGLGWVTVTSGPHAGLPETPIEQGDALALSQWLTPPAGQDRDHPPRSGRGSGALHATPGLIGPKKPTHQAGCQTLPGTGAWTARHLLGWVSLPPSSPPHPQERRVESPWGPALRGGMCSQEQLEPLNLPRGRTACSGQQVSVGAEAPGVWL